MSADDIFNVIAYGWSNKANNPEMIGMYGNGLKSGSMRVANDCLILTKKNNECSALMISRTFIENPDNKEVRFYGKNSYRGSHIRQWSLVDVGPPISE